MGNIFTHPGQPEMQAEVILASIGPNHKPIYTIRLRYPRPLHGEIMTHRMFGRNARSSRAVPVLTMLNEVRNSPYVPWHWGKNQKGMQADEECNTPITYPQYYNFGTSVSREEAWLHARDNAANIAEAFMLAGYHKQNPNRLLEPFAWIDTLITSTDWNNFFWLRDHKDAEPHLQDLAKLIIKAMDDAKPKLLKYNEWHQPYISHIDEQNLIIRPNEDTQRFIDELGCTGEELLNMISAARCARISYKPFDGNASYRAELDRYNSLVSSDRVHASPLEHQAKPDIWSPYGMGHLGTWQNPDKHGNLQGYIQARKLVVNEYVG